MRKLIFAAMMLPALASGAVYKCVDSKGGITFSDRACDGVVGGVEVDIKPSSGSGLQPRTGRAPSAEERRVDRQFDEIRRQIREPRRRASQSSTAARSKTACKDFNSTELRTLILRNQVVVGMKASDALRAWGSPKSVSSGGQHAYDWGTSSWSFFYITDGCVDYVDGAYRGGKFAR